MTSSDIQEKKGDGVQAPSPYIVEVAQLSKSFGEKKVFSDVSLRIKRGEVCSIIGPSGAGKSTFLRCLNLLEMPTSGNMSVCDQYIEGGHMPSKAHLLALRRRVGMVFQSFNLFPHLTVLKNITLPQQRVHGRSFDESRDKAMDLLSKVGLADRGDAFPSQLSGGQQQRVAIARALALDPELMLFDEPTSALDPELGLDVLNVMRSLADDGMSMIVVTHEMEFARNVGDQLVVMGEGKILEEGDPHTIMSSPSNPRTQQFLRAVIGR